MEQPIRNLQIVDDEELMILQSALYEYINNRHPDRVQDYIDKRYPLLKGYSEHFRADKLKSVTKRLLAARALRERLF